MPFAWAITHRPLCRITSRMIESEEELTLLLRAGVRVRERHAPFRSRHVWLLDRDIESIVLRFAFVGGQHWIRRQPLIATTCAVAVLLVGQAAVPAHDVLAAHTAVLGTDREVSAGNLADAKTDLMRVRRLRVIVEQEHFSSRT